MSLSRHVLCFWRVFTTVPGMFGLAWLIASGAHADEPKNCELWSEVPTCDVTYYDDPEKGYDRNIYDRNIFVNWIFQLAVYANAPRRKQIEAMTENLDWLNGKKKDPLDKMLWCTFESLAKAPPLQTKRSMQAMSLIRVKARPIRRGSGCLMTLAATRCRTF